MKRINRNDLTDHQKEHPSQHPDLILELACELAYEATQAISDMTALETAIIAGTLAQRCQGIWMYEWVKALDSILRDMRNSEFTSSASIFRLRTCRRIIRAASDRSA